MSRVGDDPVASLIGLPLVALGALLLTACDMVLLDRPLGETPAVLDAAAIDGSWHRIGDDPVAFRARSARDGEVLVVAIADSSEDIEPIPVSLMTVDGVLYASGPADDAAGGGYYFGRVARHSHDEWVVEPPDVAAFERAVRAGMLDGVVERSDSSLVVRIRSQEVIDFIRANPEAPMWNAARSIVVRRFEP